MGRRRAEEKMGRGKDWEGEEEERREEERVRVVVRRGRRKDWEGEEEEIRGRKYWKGKEILGGGGGREKGEKDKGRGERR